MLDIFVSPVFHEHSRLRFRAYAIHRRIYSRPLADGNFWPLEHRHHYHYRPSRARPVAHFTLARAIII